MPRSKAGLFLVPGLLGLAASFGVIAAWYNSPVQDLGNFRRDREAAIVRKYEGTDSLDQIIRNQGFKIKYYMPELTAAVNVHDALENACQTNEFAQTPICADYKLIQPAVAAQAQINSKYKWTSYAFLVSFVPATLGILGSLHLYERQKEKSTAASNHKALQAHKV